MTNNRRRTFISYGGFLLLVQLAAACGPAESGKEEAPQARPEANATPGASVEPGGKAAADADLVVAFGDSLFAGYQLGQDQGFAPALERELAKLGQPAHVFNAGVSGDTSAEGLQRLAYVLDGLPKKPDLVIVGLGGNDMLRGVSPEVTRKNLTAIMEELDRRNIDVVLAGMRAAPNMGRDYAQAFDPIYPDLAERYDVPLYPFILDGVIGDKKLLLPDGVHPNPQGVGKIVSGIGGTIAKALDLIGRQ